MEGCLKLIGFGSGAQGCYYDYKAAVATASTGSSDVKAPGGPAQKVLLYVVFKKSLNSSTESK